MHPSSVCPIAFTIEPPLVAAHDLSREGAGINSTDSLASVRHERRREDILHACYRKVFGSPQRGKRDCDPKKRDGGEESEILHHHSRAITLSITQVWPFTAKGKSLKTPKRFERFASLR